MSIIKVYEIICILSKILILYLSNTAISWESKYQKIKNIMPLNSYFKNHLYTYRINNRKQMTIWIMCKFINFDKIFSIRSYNYLYKKRIHSYKL